jgi:hypothetical protein
MLRAETSEVASAAGSGGDNPLSRRAGCEQHKSGSVRAGVGQPPPATRRGGGILFSPSGTDSPFGTELADRIPRSIIRFERLN